MVCIATRAQVLRQDTLGLSQSKDLGAFINYVEKMRSEVGTRNVNSM